MNPPTADHVDAVYRLLPSKHRLPLFWLDWTGARVSCDRPTLVCDYDEPRRRVRLRAATTKTRKALWVDLHRRARRGARGVLGPREDRDPDARLFAGSGADALRTSIAKACKAPGIPSGRRTTCATAGFRCCICAAAVGADRGVRRSARPDGDREHVHARPR